ncbi:hypothetical protein [Gilvibacter sp. SZ-19]|uniref:hypothetical protein n=1 Tax=unclassified Gilvibacter TaxID=2625242 RepID=UPI000B3C15DB|nr:hypothetical protein [Gilvibacter sp. SZ-19]ARV11834.1 hypothetical protein BTO09_05510 [Gilvibacter sp. SZ-19]
MSKRIDIYTKLFGLIIALMALKFLFSYLNVELGWWLRNLMPNYLKFNPLGLPKNTSEMIEFLLLPAMGTYLALSYRSLGVLRLPLLLIGIMLGLNLVTMLTSEADFLGSIKYTLKIAAPILFFCVLVVHYKRTDKDMEVLLKRALVFFSVLIVFALVFFNQSFNRGAYRLPVYFSGLHTHSYVLTICFVVLSYFLRKNIFVLISFFGLSFAFLTFGYGVRTIMVFYMLYIAVALYLRDDFIKNTYVRLIALSPLLLLGLIPSLKGFDFDRFSSGRLTMYTKKFEILKDYSFTEYLFGRGRGADYVRTTEWWYDTKGSHNDYLTFFVENGAIYLLVFLLLIVSLLFLVKRNHILFVVLIVGYLLTSAISNGFAVRALASYWLFAFLAFIYIKHLKGKFHFG